MDAGVLSRILVDENRLTADRAPSALLAMPMPHLGNRLANTDGDEDLPQVMTVILFVGIVALRLPRKKLRNALDATSSSSAMRRLVPPSFLMRQPHQPFIVLFPDSLGGKVVTFSKLVNPECNVIVQCTSLFAT